jgi:lipopolysaccharide export system permease protein
MSQGVRGRIFLIAGLLVLGGILWVWLVPGEQRSVSRQLVGFPDSDVFAQSLRVPVLGLLCFLPAMAGLTYAVGGLLDRYIARQFLVIFGICLGALFCIWLLIDLGDKLSEFRGSRHGLRTVAEFYAARSPAVLLLLLPYSLLLALLYSLGRLSVQREFIAVVQSGRGILRAIAPLAVAGLFCSLLGLGLNYHWAPVAEGRRDGILSKAAGGEVAEARSVLYRNASARRLWMIGVFPEDYEMGKPLRDVEVTTTAPDGSLRTRLSAKTAEWDRERRAWIFHGASWGVFAPGSPPVYRTAPGPMVIEGWPETPWQLVKPGLEPAFLGIPDLNAWLAANRRDGGIADPAPYRTHWHFRWALPFGCLVTVLLAAPLAIHFSRRPPGGGVFLAVVLSALMLLAGNVSLALGESGLLHPAAAAWLPNLVFGAIGLYLFVRKFPVGGFVPRPASAPGVTD